MLSAIVTSDLSEAAALGITAVCEAGSQTFAGVTLAHVVDLDLYTAGGSVPAIVEFAEAHLAEEAERLRACGIAAEVMVVQGDTIETLERIAIEKDADVIVSASLGKGAALGRVLGGTVERLASRGVVPVLVARVCVAETGACELAGAGSPLFGRVLVAVGLDEATPSLLSRVAALPGLRDVRAVHVAAPGADAASLGAQVRQAMDVAGLPRGAEVAVLDGEPAAALVQEAGTWGASVLAIASCRHGTLHRAVWGSVARTVTREAQSSVLLT